MFPGIVCRKILNKRFQYSRAAGVVWAMFNICSQSMRCGHYTYTVGILNDHSTCSSSCTRVSSISTRLAAIMHYIKAISATYVKTVVTLGRNSVMHIPEIAPFL